MKRIATLICTTTVLAAMASSEISKTEGQIEQLQFVSGQMSLRVTLAGAPRMCGNEWTYGFLNEKDMNYQAIVSALLSARASRTPVEIYSRQDASRYCRIEMVTLKKF